jgi:hypothetical protein
MIFECEKGPFVNGVGLQNGGKLCLLQLTIFLKGSKFTKLSKAEFGLILNNILGFYPLFRGLSSLFV